MRMEKTYEMYEKMSKLTWKKRRQSVGDYSGKMPWNIREF